MLAQLLSFCHNLRVRQTDRQTDGQTTFLMATPCVAWHAVAR